MLHFKKSLLILAVAASFAACSTKSETQTSQMPTAPTVSSAGSPSPENTDSANISAIPNTKSQQFNQEIFLLETLKSGKVGETMRIPVMVKNTSNFVWDSGAANPVNFSYNWFDSNGNRLVLDVERTPLPKSLAPKELEKLNALIVFPDRPGNYILALTMVQEGVTWFNDAGAQAPNIPVTVTS